MTSPLVEFISRAGFDGITPLPREAAFTVAQARKLPRVVELHGEEGARMEDTP